jgi:hypothetical protein
VDVDPAAPERAHHREKGAVLLPEHEDFARSSTHGHAARGAYSAPRPAGSAKPSFVPSLCVRYDLRAGIVVAVRRPPVIAAGFP